MIRMKTIAAKTYTYLMPRSPRGMEAGAPSHAVVLSFRVLRGDAGEREDGGIARSCVSSVGSGLLLTCCSSSCIYLYHFLSITEPLDEF